MTSSRIVPKQLAGERFIVLEQGGKNPVQKWGLPENQYSAEQVQKWINAGFNYGVMYQTDLAVLDADEADLLEDLGVLNELEPTYTIRSGRTSSVGKHLYFRISGDIPERLRSKKIILLDNDTDKPLGDLRLPGSNFYNVGPYSYHPSGRQYIPENAAEEIRMIDFSKLYEILGRVKLQEPKEKSLKSPTVTSQKGSGYDEYGFTCFDFLTPLNSRERDGNIEGAHPIHGSETGNNLSVTKDGSLWYCRRCGTGGNWIKALAVSEGIIDCSEANRDLTKFEWKRVNDVLWKLNPAVYESRWLDYQRRRVKNRTKGVIQNAVPIYEQRR